MTLEQIKANMKAANKFLENNISDDVREILAENEKVESNWFESYYSDTVGQSVIDAFESGNVRIVKL